MLVLISIMNTRSKLGLHAKIRARYLTVVPKPMPAAPRMYLIVAARRLPPAVVCQLLCASQVLGRGAEAVARGAARCASHLLNRSAQAGAQTAACGDATLPHQKKNTRQMSRGTE
jgi:hypothetical protein